MSSKIKSAPTTRTQWPSRLLGPVGRQMISGHDDGDDGADQTMAGQPSKRKSWSLPDDGVDKTPGWRDVAGRPAGWLAASSAT